MTSLFRFLGSPAFFDSWALRKAVAAKSFQVEGLCLDVGCGRKPYAALFTSAERYTGLEIDTEYARQNSAADMFYNGRELPFEDETFDSVVSFEVLEHVTDEMHFIREINRVLVGGGSLMLSVPFFWVEHELPYDFRRFSSLGLELMLENAGFSIDDREVTVGPLYTTLCLFVISIRQILRKKIHWAADALLVPLNLLVNTLGFLEYKFGVKGIAYTSTLVVARKVSSVAENH